MKSPPPKPSPKRAKTSQASSAKASNGSNTPQHHKRIKSGRVPSLTTSSDEEEEADVDVVNSSPIKNPLNSMGSFDVGPPLSPMSGGEEEEVTTTTPAPAPVVEQQPPPQPEEPSKP